MKRRAQRRQRNTTIYTGLVGARLRPRITRGYSRRIFKHMVFCHNGPWAGFSLALSSNSDDATLPIIIGGKAGRYIKGIWRHAEP